MRSRSRVIGSARDATTSRAGSSSSSPAPIAPPPAAGDVMRMMGARLGLGVVTLANVFNPEVVVVGGGAIAAGELLLAPRARSSRRVRCRSTRRRAPRAGPLRRGVGDARARRAWPSTWRAWPVA